MARAEHIISRKFASEANLTVSTSRNDAPVFIIGFPRSGTTLLLHVILSSGAFPEYGFTETHFFSHHFRRYGSLNNIRNKKIFLSALSSSDWFRASNIRIDELLETVRPDNIKYENYFSNFMALVAKKHNKTRWIEKTPWHMLYIPEIIKSHPDAKFILVVRDPRDIILSLFAYGWTGGPLGSCAKVAAAWDWHMTYTKKCLNTHEIEFLTVKYEDLTLNTNVELEKLNRFLELELDVENLKQDGFGVLKKSNSSFSTENENSNGLTSSSIGRWRNSMPAHIVSSVEYITRQHLDEHQYKFSSYNPPAMLNKLMINILINIYWIQKKIRRILFPILRR